MLQQNRITGRVAYFACERQNEKGDGVSLNPIFHFCERFIYLTPSKRHIYNPLVIRSEMKSHPNSGDQG